MNRKNYFRLLSAAALTALFVSQESTAQNFTWSSAGPIYTSGRARAMVVDRNNNNVLYVGSASGGIFKSTNAGLSWRPLNDKQERVRNISYMAQAIDGTIYASTGEGFLSIGQKARAQAGTGLYKLNDTVLVQVAPASITGTVINRIACSPINANVIAIATNSGVLVSKDKGASFTKITHTPAAVANTFYGMDVKFDNNGILYCSVGNEKGGTTQLNNIISRVYKSTDNTLSTFTEITPPASELTDNQFGRIEIAIAPSDPNVIYVSIANKNQSTANNPKPQTATLKGLFVSVDGGQTWELITQGAAQLDPLSNGGSVATGDYAQAMLVNPTDPHMLFIAGFRAYVFQASASNPAVGIWVQIGNPFLPNTPLFLNQNVHDIKVVMGNPAKFYFVTDAGIYRSTDLISTSQTQLPSFQAIYKGFVTGQFNSVSPERYPAQKGTPPGNGQPVDALYGYVGGTGGNGLVYYSGSQDLVTEEHTFSSGEVYNAEYSKILPDAVFFSTGNGTLMRTTDVRTSFPSVVNVNHYTGSLSVIAPAPDQFVNAQVTTGTNFKLWESYGQVPSPDSAIFYNDSIRVQASMIGGVDVLTSTKSFTLNVARPNKFAQIDSIAIRTATVVLPATPPQIPTPYNAVDKVDIRLNVNDVLPPATTITVPVQGGNQVQTIRIYSASDFTFTGPADTLNPAKVTTNETTLLDEIVVNFATPPFASRTMTYANITDPSIYYRVFATVFYRYDPGDSIVVSDANITTMETEWKAELTRTLRWAYDTIDPTVTVNGFVPFSPHNPPVAIPVTRSARMAIPIQAPITANQPAVVVTKAPLNLNDPMNFVRVSQSGAYKDDDQGNPTTTRLFYTGRPYLVEWSKSGTELYFATNDNQLYRVSHITRIMDLSGTSYNGKLSTDVYRYINGINSAQVNPNSPYRTTHIGAFTRTITSLTTNHDGTKLLVTFAAGTGSTATVMMNQNDVRTHDITNQVWVDKTGGLSELQNTNVYCALNLLNKQNQPTNQYLLGTDAGLLYTADITANPVVWTNANNNQLPTVQVFDIKQQTLNWDYSYNSGEIFVATNGRGVWSSRSLFTPHVVGVEEHEDIQATVGNNLMLFPNPSSDKVSVAFSSVSGENATLQLMDINGRLVYSNPLGEQTGESVVHSFDVSSLNSGIYIVNVVSDSGIQRVSKLVVTK